MESFNDCFSRRNIILQLCKIRAKYAYERNKKHIINRLTLDPNYKIQSSEKSSPDIEVLKSILPSRRNWRSLRPNSRYINGNIRIDSVSYNIKSLVITIDYYEKNYPDEPFLKNLNEFIERIRLAIDRGDYQIKTPIIIPVIKDKPDPVKNLCRPLAIYSLEDRIVINLTNKYFTNLFNSYFEPCSFAFRSNRSIDGKYITVQHHHAVESIVNYKRKYKGKRLWVTECDLKNFFDTLDHKIVSKQFKKLINKVRTDYPEVYDERAEKVFYSYLASYAFNKQVLPLNLNQSYWYKKSIPGGEFGWIERDLEKTKYYKNIKTSRIGVPQGGALSGLIANILLIMPIKWLINLQIADYIMSDIVMIWLSFILLRWNAQKHFKHINYRWKNFTL